MLGQVNLDGEVLACFDLGEADSLTVEGSDELTKFGTGELAFFKAAPRHEEVHGILVVAVALNVDREIHRP